LAEAGYALAIHGSRDAVPDAELADAFTRSGTHWSGFIADFTKEGDAERLIPAITAHFGRPPDLLVNSASLFGQDRLETVTTDDLQAHFAVNARAPVLLTRAFAEAPRESEGDLAIINILDQRLVHPHADQLSYTLAKMTLAGFTRIAARALAPRVRVNAVGPGLTLATGDYDPEKIERLASDMPLGRLPTADDVSDAVLYLAGARAVTGQTIVVAGGAQMRSFTRDFMHL
jgi:NAD(P)-dependent dehydrogenase (short-subunit alcohol dehydrogenase family)